MKHIQGKGIQIYFDILSFPLRTTFRRQTFEVGKFPLIMKTNKTSVSIILKFFSFYSSRGNINGTTETGGEKSQYNVRDFIWLLLPTENRTLPRQDLNHNIQKENQRRLGRISNQYFNIVILGGYIFQSLLSFLTWSVCLQG